MICFHLITLLIGFLITKSFLKGTENNFLIFPFSVAFGITIESFLMFILMMLNINNFTVFVVAEIMLLITAIIISVIKKIKVFPQNNYKNNCKTKNEFLNVIFIIALIIGLIQVFYTFKMHPYGTWDAHYIWNLRPKFFIALEGIQESWKVFFNPVIGWTHLDYPLLMPVYNYKNHILNGIYDPTLNTLTSVLILGAILCGVYGLVSEISCRKNALLSVIILLTTGCFIFLAMSQCADVPLSFFILMAAASISLFVKYQNKAYIFFAYYFASSAAFCKNEGIMFFLIFTLTSLLLIKNQNKKMIVFGILLPFICLVLHKVFIYSTCDLFEDQSFSMILNRILDLERYKMIIFIVAKHFIEYYFTLIIFFCGVFWSGFAGNIKLKTLGKMYISIVLLAMLGYFTIYVITPRELEWHLNTTDIRLIAQYIPLFIVFCFSAFNCANENNALPNIEDCSSEKCDHQI